MKTKIATAVSIVAVLGAGSAAAMVNTKILDGPQASGPSAAILPSPTTVDLPLDATADTSSTSVPSTTQPSLPSTTLPTTSTAPGTPPPSGMLTAFNVGDAGVVTVDVLDGRLTLVSAVPNAGWQLVTAQDDRDDDSDGVDEIEVEFASGTTVVEFEATLIDGAIVPKVESRSTTVSSGTTRTTTAGGRSGDDSRSDDDDSDDRPSSTIRDDDDDSGGSGRGSGGDDDDSEDRDD